MVLHPDAEAGAGIEQVWAAGKVPHPAQDVAAKKEYDDVQTMCVLPHAQQYMTMATLHNNLKLIVHWASPLRGRIFDRTGHAHI